MDHDFANAVINFALWRDPERVAEVIANVSCQLEAKGYSAQEIAAGEFGLVPDLRHLWVRVTAAGEHRGDSSLNGEGGGGSGCVAHFAFRGFGAFSFTPGSSPFVKTMPAASSAS